VTLSDKRVRQSGEGAQHYFMEDLLLRFACLGAPTPWSIEIRGFAGLAVTRARCAR
jgi:hypothetical protein